MAIRRAASGETTRRATEYPLNDPVSLRLVTRSLRGGTRGPTGPSHRRSSAGPTNNSGRSCAPQKVLIHEGGRLLGEPSDIRLQPRVVLQARLVSLGGLSC